MKQRTELSAERLRAMLAYNPETGDFHHIQSRGGSRAGSLAGCVNKALGYRIISIDYRRYYAHRLVWLYVHGRWPTAEVDHVNGERSDNRIVNLREATSGQNSQNKRRARIDSTSGLIGAGRHQGGWWRARIKVAGQVHDLGLFATPEAASAAYLKAKHELHPFWAEA